MKAFLKNKWGANYAGQTLTGVTKGSIPADVADFYEDNEPGPGDVVNDASATGHDPLQVINDAIDPKAAKAVAEQKADVVARATKGQTAQGKAAAIEAHEAELAQKHAREADEFAAKQAKDAEKGAALSKEEKAGAEAGKGHGVK